MALEKNQKLGHGHRPNNPVARRIRRERVLSYWTKVAESEEMTEEKRAFVNTQIENLKDILSGARWERLKAAKALAVENFKSGKTTGNDNKSRYENEVIDIYKVTRRYESMRAKKDARRSSNKTQNASAKRAKGWNRTFVKTVANGYGVLALLKSGKYRGFSFDPTRHDGKYVFQTRNTLEQSQPLNKG